MSTLFWSQEENVIFEQLKNAIRDNADLILTDLFPDELPNLTTNEEYKFFKERFIFPPPFYNSDLTRNETSSKNDKIIYITDKTLETGDDFSKVLDILSKSNEIKDRMVFIESENEDVRKIIDDNIHLACKVVINSLNPNIIHYISIVAPEHSVSVKIISPKSVCSAI